MTAPPGARTYTVNPVPTFTAIQLTEDADWSAVAAWAGGFIASRPVTPGYQVHELHIPGGYTAERGDWVIRKGEAGSFFVRSPDSFAACYEPY